MTLRDPIIITPRLLPGVKIGNTFISLERDGETRDNRDRFRWSIDLDGKEYSGNDLKSGCGGCSMLEAFRSLVSFLSAAVESYSYKQRTGREGENIDLFPLPVVEWAYQHSSEIESLSLDLDPETEGSEELIDEN